MFNRQKHTDSGRQNFAGGNQAPPLLTGPATYDTAVSCGPFLKSTPTRNLPRGGAIRALSEKLAAHLDSGMGSMMVPVATTGHLQTIRHWRYDDGRQAKT